jgi:hypothetical protein
MTIGPKVNPRPLILHVDSETNIPYRLAESNEIVVDKITANNWVGLPPGNVTSIDQLAGTGIFATTATNVTSFAGANVLATVSYVEGTFVSNGTLDNLLINYAGPYETPSTGQVPYYDGTKWNAAIPNNNGEVLTNTGGVPTWELPAGVISTPVAISLGGTNATATPITNGVIYYNGTRYTTNNNLRFDGTNTSANALTLTTALTQANGGTGVTSIGNLNVSSFGGSLPINRGGTNFTGPYQNNSVLYFNQAVTAVSSSSNLTFNGTTLSANTIAATNPITVANGGTGRSTLTAGNFLIGDGTNQVSLQPTGNFLTTGTAATTYFPLTGQTLGVAQGGTGSTSFTSRGILFSDTNVTTSPNLKLGTTFKLLAVCGVAIPSKGLYIEGGVDNPTSPFNLKDIPDVDTTSPTNGQVLSYNNTTSKWTPTTLAGASETWTTIFATANQSNSTTSLTNSLYLSSTLNAGFIYFYEMNIFFSAASTEKFDFKVNSPDGDRTWGIEYTGPTAGYTNQSTRSGSGDMPEQENRPVDTNGVGFIKITGVVDPELSGNLVFRFAVNTSGSNEATILNGSYLKIATIS